VDFIQIRAWCVNLCFNVMRDHPFWLTVIRDLPLLCSVKRERLWFKHFHAWNSNIFAGARDLWISDILVCDAWIYKNFAREAWSWPPLFATLSLTKVYLTLTHFDRSVMLDGKEINETAKRFLINWKATKDARRKQKKQFQLEHPSSYNSLSTVPTLPALQGSTHSTMPGSGYFVDRSINPMVRLAGHIEPSQAGYFAKNHKALKALVQARAPNSTLLRQRVHHSDFSQSR